MFPGYFRDIVHGLRRATSSSIISIIGLSVGLAVFILIMLFVNAELRVNRTFPEYNNIYRISGGDGTGWQGTPARLGEILAAKLPEVLSFVRIEPGGTNHVFKIDNVPVRTGKLTYVDSTFFSLFSLPFKYGDPLTCLTDKFSVVITESLSRKLFGDESPLGFSVKLDSKYDAIINGVIYDQGQSTHIDGDVFISFHSMADMKNWPDLYDCYTCYNYQTYLLLEEDVDPLLLTEKINDMLDDYGVANNIVSLVEDEYSLTNMHDVYFGPEERPEFRKGNYLQLRILTLIGVIILLVAIINYINLATAQAGSRLRLLALRKIIGASRMMLVSVIMGEAILVSMLSLAAGLLIVEVVKPFLSSVLDNGLNINYLEDPLLLAVFICSGVLIGVLSGLYPALSVTGFSITGSLTTNIKETSSGGQVRKVLTALQVFVSISLIACTLIIYRQLVFIDRADLGFDKDVLVYLPVNSEIKERKEVFREELLKQTGIGNVSYSYASYRTSNERWGFEYNDNDASLHMEAVDENYLSTLGLELMSGRDFRGRQDSLTIIVNQEACRQYFGSNPEGTIIESLDGLEIIGVIKDFRFLTFDREVEPIGLMYRPGWTSLCNIRLSGEEFAGALKQIETVWSRFCTEYPFEYHFVDKLYEERYSKYKNTGRLLVFFSIVSVLIASLGIFGLASFTVSRRSREVGIRKVNGASIREVVNVLVSDINMMVLWTVIPASLVVYIIMSRWLNSFAYHASLPFWVFPLASLAVWLIAILSTISKTVAIARTNPVEVLRSE